MPVAALSQSTNNWIGTTPAYGTTTNWQNSAIPLSSETAVFSTLGTARSLAIGTGTSVGGWQFSAGAPAYTFSVQNTYQFLTTGIVNSSSSAPIVTVTATGDLNFSNSTSAGIATIRNAISGAKTTFKDSASAGTASLGNLTAGTSLIFQDTASAGSAAITNTNGTVSFTGSASAGSASITSSGPTGLASFSGSATAGSATITSGSGGKTSFTGSSTGGQARLIANPGAFVDISGLATSGMTVGSIEGPGTYRLGSKQFTVGTNNIAGLVSGSIVDGGDSGGTGGSLVKTGTGTLILSGNSTYTGGTTISGGTLQIGNTGTTGSLLGNIVNNSALVFNRTNQTIVNNVISGTGTMQQNGTSLLLLTGANSYTGATIVSRPRCRSARAASWARSRAT